MDNDVEGWGDEAEDLERVFELLGVGGGGVGRQTLWDCGIPLDQATLSYSTHVTGWSEAEDE